MTKPSTADDCQILQSYHAYYPVPTAAALWCGVPPKTIETLLQEAEPIEDGIFHHPKIACLDERCRVIHEAIEQDQLPCGRLGNGRSLHSRDPVPRGMRTIQRRDFKDWIEREFPADKPSLLFDAVERQRRSGISVETFLALKAEHDRLEKRLIKQKRRCKRLQGQKKSLKAHCHQLEETQQHRPLGERAETTYLNIIAALMELLLPSPGDSSPAPRFRRQADVIEALLARHEGKPGLSQRTLQAKLAAANQRFRAS